MLELLALACICLTNLPGSTCRSVQQTSADGTSKHKGSFAFVLASCSPGNLSRQQPTVDLVQQLLEPVLYQCHML